MDKNVRKPDCVSGLGDHPGFEPGFPDFKSDAVTTVRMNEVPT